MNLETRVYQALLKLYPRAFRDQYGEEMTRVFQDSLNSQGSSFGFWIRTVWDVISSASHERILGGKTMRTQNPIALIGGIAALLYGLIPAIALFTTGLLVVNVDDSNIWFYWSLESIGAIVIPSIAIFASLKSISPAPTRLQQFGCLLSIVALVFSRWFLVASIVPLVDLAVFRSPWIGTLITLGLPTGLLLMAFGQVIQTGIHHLQPLSKILIGISTMLVLSFLAMNWLKYMFSTEPQLFLIFLFCLVQLPWIRLGWLLLSSRQPHSAQARMA
jgi:hypothetical protein